MTVQETPQPQASGIPMPDLEVCADMQMGMVTRMAEVQQAKKAGKPVVWTSLLMPKEIFYAMDVPVMQLEVLGGQASMFQLAGGYSQVVEDRGLSRDTCAVQRCAAGIACTETRDAFFEGVFAAPDLTIASNFPCTQEAKAPRFVVEQYGCPCYFLDTPMNPWGEEIPNHPVEYYANQLLGMIRFLEDHGFKMDWDRLKEEIAFTKALSIITEEIEAYRQAVPTPMTPFDSFIMAAAPLAIPSSMRKIELWERLRDELRERVRRGAGTVEEEKIRLLWLGIPPTCDFRLLDYPNQYGAVFVKSTLEFLLWFSLSPKILDPENPLESLAKAILCTPSNPPYKSAIGWIVQLAKDYRVDGAVSVVKRSCSLMPGMQRLTKEAIFRETGAPSIVFDLDGVDEREYDPTPAKSSLDSFVENLLAAKGQA
jgi:benzoyl-CoA reductase/2-hydroxyglutaryl-CoA dehydratase subunit BcrC/BadD/HgdB